MENIVFRDVITAHGRILPMKKSSVTFEIQSSRRAGTIIEASEKIGGTLAFAPLKDSSKDYI